jgi:hypothetical protein
VTTLSEILESSDGRYAAVDGKLKPQQAQIYGKIHAGHHFYHTIMSALADDGRACISKNVVRHAASILIGKGLVLWKEEKTETPSAARPEATTTIRRYETTTDVDYRSLADVERCTYALIGCGCGTFDDLAEYLEADRSRIRDAVAELIDAGFVTRTDGEDTEFSPAHTDTKRTW